jgi:hypothetical protein
VEAYRKGSKKAIAKNDNKKIVLFIERSFFKKPAQELLV